MDSQAPVALKVTAMPPIGAKQVLWQRVKSLQDAYRSALRSRRYYGYRLATVKKWNLALEISLAVGTSSVIGAWVIWKSNPGNIIWTIVAGLSAILAILKPILQLPKEIERYSKLFTEYGNSFYDLEILVKEVEGKQEFGPKLEESFRKIQERLKIFCGEDDPKPSEKLVNRCHNEVLELIPVETLWRPQE